MRNIADTSSVFALFVSYSILRKKVKWYFVNVVTFFSSVTSINTSANLIEGIHILYQDIECFMALRTTVRIETKLLLS